MTLIVFQNYSADLKNEINDKKKCQPQPVNYYQICLYLQSGYIYLLSYCLLSDYRHVGNLRVD